MWKCFLVKKIRRTSQCPVQLLWRCHWRKLSQCKRLPRSGRTTIEQRNFDNKSRKRGTIGEIQSFIHNQKNFKKRYIVGFLFADKSCETKRSLGVDVVFGFSEMLHNLTKRSGVRWRRFWSTLTGWETIPKHTRKSEDLPKTLKTWNPLLSRLWWTSA